jgi:hypothetical protein
VGVFARAVTIFSRHRRLAAVGSILSVSALAVGLSAVPASAAAAFTPLQVGTYCFNDVATGYGLVDSISAVNGTTFPATVPSTGCGGGSTLLQWTVYTDPFGGFNLVNTGTGQCLDSNYAANVYTDSCNWNDSYQNWTFGGEGPGSTIQDGQTLLCLDSNESGDVYTYSCNWNDNYQNWTIGLITPG